MTNETTRENIERLASGFEESAELSCMRSNDDYRDVAKTLRALLAENEALKEQAAKDAENINLKADFIEAMLNQIAPGEPENRGEDQ